jgi:hypothetical protein
VGGSLRYEEKLPEGTGSDRMQMDEQFIGIIEREA